MPRMQVPERVYQGALLGVTSIVVLHGSAEYATIVLKGKPLLGTVRGRATMNSDGSVNMDKTLDNAMSRRCASVRRVIVRDDGDALEVGLKLPFLGAKTVVLYALN